MIYLDLILTDTEDSIDITGKRDHRWMGLKDVVKKPKVTLWQLYKLKKFIETGYERLKKENTEVLSDAGSVEPDLGDTGEEHTGSDGESKTGVESNQG